MIVNILEIALGLAGLVTLLVLAFKVEPLEIEQRQNPLPYFGNSGTGGNSRQRGLARRRQERAAKLGNA